MENKTYFRAFKESSSHLMGKKTPADFFNISQISGLLGQQNLQGKRVQPALNNGTRTLPHYPFKNLPVDLEYESRGFVSSSFIQGLNPKHYWYHAMSGREGCCDKLVSLIGSCLSKSLNFLMRETV